MLFDKCRVPCIHHYRITKNSVTTLNNPVGLTYSPLSPNSCNNWSIYCIYNFACSQMSYKWPHGLQPARPLCPSLSPRICSDSRPLSWRCHPTTSYPLSSPSPPALFLAAKNIINLILVLTFWWCPCVELCHVLLEEGICYDQCAILAKLW